MCVVRVACCLRVAMFVLALGVLFALTMNVCASLFFLLHLLVFVASCFFCGVIVSIGFGKTHRKIHAA